MGNPLTAAGSYYARFGSTDAAYDRDTGLLRLSAPLDPGEIFTLTFAIGDFGDGGADSGVYLADLHGVQPVPVPATVWLFGSGLLALMGIRRRKRRAP